MKPPTRITHGRTLTQGPRGEFYALVPAADMGHHRANFCCEVFMLLRLLGRMLRNVHADENQLLCKRIPTGVTPIKLTSSTFANHGTIPERYAKWGDNISPALAWSGVPQDARELVLIMEDPDAPLRRPSLHMVATGIAPTCTDLPEGALNPPSQTIRLQKHRRTRQGYIGPGAPPGHGPHRYIFQLVALRRPLPETVTYAEIVQVLTQDNVAGFGQLTGMYERL